MLPHYHGISANKKNGEGKVLEGEANISHFNIRFFDRQAIMQYYFIFFVDEHPMKIGISLMLPGQI